MQRSFRTTNALLVVAAYWVLAVSPLSKFVFAETRDCNRIQGMSEAAVKGGEIYLADVLRLDTLNPALRKLLGTAILGQAPPAGRARIFSQAEVIQRLELLGVSARSYCLEIPEEIRVVRSSRILSLVEIESAVVSEFLPTLLWKEVHLEKLEVLDPIQLPEGKASFSFTCSPKTDLARPFYLTVNISVDGETVRQLFLRTLLSIEDTVAVAARDLASANLIGPEDFRMEWKRLNSTWHAPIRDIGLLDGKRPRTSIPMGQILTEDLLVTAPLIKRGDTVTIVYQNERLRVATQAKSLESGGRGGKIRVMNLDSKKVIRVEIVDQSTARVVF